MANRETATRKLSARLGMDDIDLDVVEVNVAFVAQALACLAELELEPVCFNPNGGAIALGHPVGASGSRLVTTLVHELREQKLRRDLATMCIGVGQGISAAFERAA
jgi:acetyl-CoA acetyltransferase